MKQYAVMRGKKRVGSAQVEQQHLYLHISVRCEEPMRVSVTGERGNRDLGLCVPMGNSFGLETRIPSKYLGNEDLIFRTTEPTDSFYPVHPDEPFSCLEKLRGAILTHKDGQIGIQISISNPTGQWSDPKTSE